MKSKKNNRTALIAGGVVACLLVVFAGVVAVNTLLDSQKTEEFAVTAPVQKLVVAADAGDVKVVATDADRVTVRRTMHWVTSEPKPTTTVTGGVLRLGDHCGGLTPLRCETSYRIEVPRRLAVDVKVDSGNVDVRGVTNGVDLSSDSGDIDVELPRGEYALDTHTDSGDTSVRGIIRNDRAPRAVTAHSDSGDVTVAAY